MVGGHNVPPLGFIGLKEVPEQLQANSEKIFTTCVALSGKHFPPLLHSYDKHVNMLFSISISSIT